MNIFDIFKPQQPAPAPVPQQQAVPPNQGNIPAEPNVAVNPDGTPAVAPLPAEPESPLAEFKNLWETAPVDPNAPEAPKGFVPPTAEQIQASVAKADFTKSFTPEQLAAVTSGGEGSQEALMQMLNTVGQQSLAQATMVSTKLNETAMEAAINAEVAKMPALMRQQSTTNHMKTVNPVFSNPAVKPIVEATQQQLQTKFPNASDAEITTMTQDFIVAMGAEFAPKPEADPALAGETDWNAFFENNVGG